MIEEYNRLRELENRAIRADDEAETRRIRICISDLLYTAPVHEFGWVYIDDGKERRCFYRRIIESEGVYYSVNGARLWSVEKTMSGEYSLTTP